MDTKRWLVLAAMLVLMVGCRQESAPVERSATPVPEETTAPSPSPVRTGVTILADGVVQTVQPALPLTFETGGKLLAVHVGAGDLVQAGDLIATLDDTHARDQVAQAQLTLQLAELRSGASEQEIAVAEASLQSAKASLQSAKASLASAQAGLVSAQSGLTKAELSRDALSDADVTAAANLASARAVLSSAQAQLAALLEGADAETVEQARLNWEQVKNSLWNTQLERDAVNGRPGTPGYMKKQMGIAVANAEIAVQLAEISYRQAQEGATDEAIAAASATVISAEAQVTTAQASLDDIDDQIAQAEASVTQAEASVAQAEAGVLQAEAGVLQAEAGVAQAEANLASLLAGASAKDLVTAEINVAQARLALESAQRGLDNVELIATASGTVTAVKAAPGALVGSGSPIVTLLDMTQLEFHTTNLSERDLAQVLSGQTAVITLKAYPNEPIEAVVVRIGLQTGVAVGDAATFPVVLVLSETDLDIRPGMTGRAEIRCEE